MIMNTNQKRLLRDKLSKLQDDRCCYCEKPFKRGNPATLEHLILDKSDTTRDSLGNLAVSHRSCNMGRGDVHWLIYKSYILNEFY